MDVEQVEARAALLKFAALALVVAVVLGVGTFVVVKALGLSGGDSRRSSVSASSGSGPSQLPTVAITPSGGASPSPSTEPSTPSDIPTEGITLVAPAQSAPGQRLKLSGQYPGADGVTLQVQRQTGGAWAQFADVAVTVHAGSFATYIITSQRGPTSFRLLDPTTGLASNVVSVTIG